MAERMALLICGQPRTMEYCFPSHQQHILDVYHPDVFIVTDDQGRRMDRLYRPVAMDVLMQDEINRRTAELRKNLNPEIVPEPVLSVGYKGLRCGEMKREYERANGFVYDVVMITRFDVKFASIQPIHQVEENAIYVPKLGGQWKTINTIPGEYLQWNGYAMHLCWMSSRVADSVLGIYFDGIDWNRRAMAAIPQWGENPEHVMKYYCDQNAIRPVYFDARMMLIRGTNDNPLAWNHGPLSEYPEF